MQAFIDYYQTLSLTPAASPEAIKKQYHRLAMIAHPDRGGPEAVMSRLNDAYSVLSEPSLRQKYDEVYRQYYAQLLQSPAAAHPSSEPISYSHESADFSEVNVKYTFIMKLKAYIRYQLLFDLAWLFLKSLYALLDFIRSLLEG